MSEIQLFSPEALIDPYPAYKQLRDEAPVCFIKEMNIHVVTRYDLLRDAIRRTEEFSSKFDTFLGGAQQMMFSVLDEPQKLKAMEISSKMVVTPPTMLTLDEPEHTKYRSLVSRLFTVSQTKLSESDVRRVVEKSIETMRGKTRADFVEDFAFPVPLVIISDRLGIPEEDKAFFYEAATAAASGLKMSPVSGEVLLERLQLAVDLQQLLIRLMNERRAEPRDDMITILATATLQDEERLLSDGEVLSILNQFLVAGHETTASTFGWGMLNLIKQPELVDRLRGNEKLIRTFVEETLRLEAPVQGLPRLVTRDTTLGDYKLKQGDMIMLRFGAANRDERQFPNPDSVDIDREKPGMQMAFSSGIHHCIGAPLARQELNLGFHALLEAFTHFHLDESKTPPVADPSVILRGMPHLHICYDEV